MADKRRASFQLRPEAAKHIDECFKTQQAMLGALGQNAKTGPKILSEGLVKREQMKSFATEFLGFLSKWADGRITADTSKYYDDDIAKAIRAYLPDGNRVGWEQLCIEAVDG